MAKSIGVFDSGVGGLTVLRAIHETLPERSTIYLGDTARVPYGTRSAEVVEKYSINNARTLLNAGALEMLVVACNTASAVAIEALQKTLPIPVVGVIEPGAQAAMQCSEGGGILVLGTAGTVKSEAYIRALRNLGFKGNVSQRSCPLLVPLVEEGWVKGEIPEKVLMKYLHDIDHHTDTVILGCTHYPLLRESIEKVLRKLGSDAKVIDGAKATAEHVAKILVDTDSANEKAHHRYLVTDAPEQLALLAPRFLEVATFDAEVTLTDVLMS